VQARRVVPELAHARVPLAQQEAAEQPLYVPVLVTIVEAENGRDPVVASWHIGKFQVPWAWFEFAHCFGLVPERLAQLALPSAGWLARLALCIVAGTRAHALVEVQKAAPAGEDNRILVADLANLHRVKPPAVVEVRRDIHVLGEAQYVTGCDVLIGG
jgi:hypothetical protein